MSTADTAYANGLIDGIESGNQQAVIREAQLMSATASDLANTGHVAEANALQSFAEKMLERAIERRRNQEEKPDERKRN